MGSKVKIQRVERGKTKSFHVNFPASVALAGHLEKGEEIEWFINDRDTFVLMRLVKVNRCYPNKQLN